MTVSTNSKIAIPNQLKDIRDNHGRLERKIPRTGAVLYHPFGFNQEGNQEGKKWMHYIAPFRMECHLLGRNRSGVGVGVDILKPESEP